MSGRHNASSSKVGAHYIYEDGDQRTFKEEAFHNENQHHRENFDGYMKKGKLEAMNQMREEDIQDQVQERLKRDPTYPAMLHGNEPSRGAKIDAEIQAEEEEFLKKKKQQTDSMPGKKLGHHGRKHSQ
ncbi:hypothetical protein JX265_006014 [Neoarthrinium moseri]|uniref:Uncharacterized protein n=1 Tax=Neoarthrinium moseri TaxID=1658444 RepID=A0A9Q0APV7_9PEZI|nr:uncharacterized protein JN550_004232 [Neoarthrinium moseri]KAI1855611.1 hypothetical protein JX266_000476 [Neoarthrinium moseri]KAI1870974.1 hypothetical protein JX265_006014 [Neoarthrinium moseri]KAI1872029.1 hypothetical protein JN550_004232 [Neoarthrinium moseri]